MALTVSSGQKPFACVTQRPQDQNGGWQILQPGRIVAGFESGHGEHGGPVCEALVPGVGARLNATSDSYLLGIMSHLIG